MRGVVILANAGERLIPFLLTHRLYILSANNSGQGRALNEREFFIPPFPSFIFLVGEGVGCA